MFLSKCVLTQLTDKPGLTQITGYCPGCGARWDLTLTQDTITKYAAGAKVQDVFPNLSPSNRELLMSGVCNDCFENAEECPYPTDDSI